MAEELDLGRSTTHRYATTLVTLGYLEQGPSRKYRLSSRVSDFGLSLLDSMVVRRVAREHLRELRARTGRTASLGVLGGPRLPTSTAGRGPAKGSMRSMRASGWARACPSTAPPRVRRSWRACPRRSSGSRSRKLRLVKRGPKTITTKTALRTELERIVAGRRGGGRGRGAARRPARDRRGGRGRGGRRGRGRRAGGSRERLHAASELLKELGPKVTTTAQRIAAALKTGMSPAPAVSADSSAPAQRGWHGAGELARRTIGCCARCCRPAPLAAAPCRAAAPEQQSRGGPSSPTPRGPARSPSAGSRRCPPRS